MFDRCAVLELVPVSKGQVGSTVRPDPVKKIKVSLLDSGFSAIEPTKSDSFEVFKTAPSGDVARVRIVAFSDQGDRKGELRLITGPRTYDHYFREDPILDHLN